MFHLEHYHFSFDLARACKRIQSRQVKGVSQRLTVLGELPVRYNMSPF